MKGLLQRVYYSIYDNKFNFIQIFLRALTRCPGQIDGHKSSMQYSVKLPWPSREARGLLQEVNYKISSQ